MKRKHRISRPKQFTRRVCFVYAAGDAFSGQRFATELLTQYLPRRFLLRSIHLPVLGQSRFRYFRFLADLLSAWAKIAVSLGRFEAFHFSLGQTWVSFVRDIVPVLLIKTLSRRAELIFSLNGNLFTTWACDSYRESAFRLLFSLADKTTVVGPMQRSVLNSRFGVALESIWIIDNPCPIQAEAADTVVAKHRQAIPLRVLYLSNLIESKGFPEFVEAIELLSRGCAFAIAACLVGTFVNDHYKRRFRTRSEAEAWITEKLRAINSSGSVSLTWVRGAAGHSKAEFFRASHVFVLPSTYPVEAQPLVLLEAMASGNAIVCTRAGEIGSTLSPKEAVFLGSTDPCEIATAIERLGAVERRLPLAMASLESLRLRFSRERFLDAWMAVLATGAPVSTRLTATALGRTCLDSPRSRDATTGPT